MKNSIMKKFGLLIICLCIGLLVFSQNEEIRKDSVPVNKYDCIAGTHTIINPKTDEEMVYMVVEDMPGFNGEGQIGFQKYIAENIIYPKEAAVGGIQGTVYIQFIVNKFGKVTDAIIARGVHESLDKEALRVVTESPEWKPGKQRGKAVNVHFIFPIKFQLQIEKEIKKKISQ